jgi:hypothetical protein
MTKDGDAAHGRRPPRMRGIQYAAASRLDHCCLWNTGSPAGACHRARIRATRWRVTTTEYAFEISRRNSPEVCWRTSRPLVQRAQGRPGARCTRGLACNCAQKTRTRAYRFSGNTPAFPAQWLYGLLRALPGERLSCHRRRRDTSRPLDASTAASGPHDFAVRSSHTRQSQLSRPSHLTARS